MILFAIFHNGGVTGVALERNDSIPEIYHGIPKRHRFGLDCTVIDKPLGCMNYDVCLKLIKREAFVS